MSSGHQHAATPAGVSARTVERYLHDPKLLTLVARVQRIDREHDLPYLAGYSVDGTTIYIDRHLPEIINAHEDGRKFSFNPDSFLEKHEKWEKALIDAFDWEYAPAHQIATKIEHRAVLAAGIPLHLYDGRNSAIQRYIKADEHEKLKRLPKDLDLTPYEHDWKLLNHMLPLMGEGSGKVSQDVVHYHEHGRPAEHCGPVKGWAKGDCHYWAGSNQCHKVDGAIIPKGWCLLWRAK